MATQFGLGIPGLFSIAIPGVGDQLEQAYAPKPGETFEQWKARVPPQLWSVMTPEMFKTYASGAPNAQLPQQPQGNPQQDGINQQIQDFIKWANGPLDMNDPEVRHLTQMAQSGAANEAFGRGLDPGLGGMAVANTQHHVANAQAGLQHQRRGLGMQALGLASQNMNAEANRVMQDKRFAYQQAMQNWMSEQQRRQSQSQGLGAGLGGLLGGLGGFAAHKFGMLPSGWGMEKAIGTGLDFGKQVGAGYGGLSAPYTPPPNYGGGRYGGNY